MTAADLERYGLRPFTPERVRLPVLRFDRWLEDTPRVRSSRRNSPIIQPGYRKGYKPPNHGLRYPADPPTPAEVLRILDANDLRTKSGVRNRALIALLWRTGLRISEALDLLPHHVDFDAKTVTVLCGKGSKRRTVGIDDGALAEVSRWLFVRMLLPIDQPRCPLFCSVLMPDPGKRLWAAYARERCRELGVKAGIPKRIHPHCFRHALAVELCRERVPMPILQRQLGHSSLATTANYLASISAFEVVEIVSARQWPGGAR